MNDIGEELLFSMEDSDLETLVSGLESDRVELKESLSDPDRIGQAICAFANDLPNHRLPGVVVVGLRDDGTHSGLNVTDELLRRLSEFRDRGNILPLPAMQVQKRSLARGEVAVVIVEPSLAPPVRYKGRVWVRVGPRRAIASQEDEARLSEKRRWRDLPFELRPVGHSAVDDLDLDLFFKTYLPAEQSPEDLALNRRTIEHQLASVRFTSPPPDCIPTILGILVVGKNPRDFVPGAYVQFLRIRGTELTDPIVDQKEIDGPMPDLLRNLEEILEINIAVASDSATGLREVLKPDYPLEALRQFVRNAVLHRTYETSHAPVRLYWFDDRVEIFSPGGPFGQVTRSNFGRPGVTDYRNNALAGALKSLGYVQRFGIGIPTARAALERNGNPPPEFLVEETGICVRIRSAS